LADDFITRKGDASLFACDGAVATFPALKLILLCREE